MEGCETGCQDQANLKPARSIWLSITELCVRADWIRSEECLHKIKKKQKKQRQVRKAKGVNPLEEKGEASSKRGQSKVHTCNIDWVERRLWKEETRGWGGKYCNNLRYTHIYTSGCLCHIQKNTVASWKTCLNLGTVIYITAYLHHFYLSFSE